jgi:hypothetical protein
LREVVEDLLHGVLYFDAGGRVTKNATEEVEEAGPVEGLVCGVYFATVPVGAFGGFSYAIADTAVGVTVAVAVLFDAISTYAVRAGALAYSQSGILEFFSQSFGLLADVFAWFPAWS